MENGKMFRTVIYTGLAAYLLYQTTLFGMTAKPFYTANENLESRKEMNEFVNSLEYMIREGIITIK